MKLSEWRESFLNNLVGPNPSKFGRSLFGKPYILKRQFKDIHLTVINGETLVTTKLLENGALIFKWDGYDYGCCASGEHLFAVPPLIYTQGISLKDVELFEGEVDWDAEVPGLKLVG
jgi:hypothetical protein